MTEEKKKLTQEQIERLPLVVQRDADDDTKREFCNALDSSSESLFAIARAVDNVKNRYSTTDPTKAETYNLALIQQVHRTNGGREAESWYAGYLMLGHVLNTSPAAAVVIKAVFDEAGDQKSATRFRALAVEAQIVAWRIK